MRIVAYLLATLVGFFGVMFLVGYQGNVMRLVVGVVLMAAAGAIVLLARSAGLAGGGPVQIVQKIDLSGDVSLQALKCNNCGHALDKRSITVKAGAIFVDCPACDSSYQFEEAARW